MRIILFFLHNEINENCCITYTYVYIYASSVTQRRATDEDCRRGQKYWTLYIFYWIKVFLKLLSVFHLVLYLLQFNTRYFVNHLERFNVSLYIYICMQGSE